MKILLPGAGGQLGRQLHSRLLAAGHEVVPTDSQSLDFLRPETFGQVITSVRPDWIVNCAAYTRVDQAESDTGTAYTINRDAPGRLAELATEHGARMLQVSTDYVFDGSHTVPYRETDMPAPLGVYGASKLAGERAVLAGQPGAIVLRTAWVYGAHGHNFALAMLRLARAGKPLRVVDDQVGSPTWTGDIADVIGQLLEVDAGGLFHFTAAGTTSWHGFACAVLDEAQQLGFAIRTRSVEPIPTSAYPTPALRPAWSVLDTGKIESLLSYRPPAWRDSLVRMLGELQACTDCS